MLDDRDLSNKASYNLDQVVHHFQARNGFALLSRVHFVFHERRLKKAVLAAPPPGTTLIHSWEYQQWCAPLSPWLLHVHPALPESSMSCMHHQQLHSLTGQLVVMGHPTGNSGLNDDEALSLLDAAEEPSPAPGRQVTSYCPNAHSYICAAVNVQSHEGATCSLQNLEPHKRL